MIDSLLGLLFSAWCLIISATNIASVTTKLVEVALLSSPSPFSLDTLTKEFELVAAHRTIDFRSHNTTS